MSVITGFISPFPRYRVLLRENWADEWQTPSQLFNVFDDVLQPIRATQTVGPSIPTATFLWRWGRIKWERSPVYLEYDILSEVGAYGVRIMDMFVRIDAATGDEANPTYKPIWVGVFGGDERDILGGQAGDHGAGNQTLTAYGLEYLLDRTDIECAWFMEGLAKSARMNVVPPFNERYVRGLQEVGNRSINQTFSTASNKHRTYLFSGDNEVWSGLDILNYLLAHYQPKGVDFRVAPVGEEETETGQHQELDKLTPARFDVAGETVLSAINRLIDRRQGLGWTIRYIASENGDEDEARIHVFSVIEEDVTLFEDSGGEEEDADPETILPANLELIETYSISGLSPEQVTQIKSSTIRYERIHVIGEPIRVMFSLWGANAGIASTELPSQTLDKGWTSTEEAAYLAGVTTGTPTQEDHDNYRGSDTFRHVFTTFVPHSSFDFKPKAWRTATGLSPKMTAVAISIQDDGKIVPGTASKIRTWHHARAFEDHLLIRGPSGSATIGELLPPLALIKTPRVKSGGTIGYVHVDRLDGPDVSPAHVRMLDRKMGVEIHFSPNHLAAKNQWTGTIASSSSGAPLEWESLILTVATKLDECLRFVVQDAAPTPLTDEEARNRPDPFPTLTIRVSGAHLWWISPGTVKGVNADGTLNYFDPEALVKDYYDEETGEVSASPGCVIRNDIDRLKRIGRFAKAWYARDRSAMIVRVREMLVDDDPESPLNLAPGNLVAQFQNEVHLYQANTIVTEREWDFLAGTTQITTGYVELDFVNR